MRARILIGLPQMCAQCAACICAHTCGACDHNGSATKASPNSARLCQHHDLVNSGAWFDAARALAVGSRVPRKPPSRAITPRFMFGVSFVESQHRRTKLRTSRAHFCHRYFITAGSRQACAVGLRLALRAPLLTNDRSAGEPHAWCKVANRLHSTKTLRHFLSQAPRVEGCCMIGAAT